jgi:hypothetical protein
MHRNSLIETAGRVFHQAVRMTMNKANDNPMMQEMSFDGMMQEGRKIVERIQAFGITTMPLPRDQQSGGDSGGGGSPGGGDAPMGGKAPEGLAIFLGGQRNHPVVIAVDDRRHRPMGMKPGESFQYDHQGQGTLIRNFATFMLSLDDDGSGQQPGAVMLKDKDGKDTGQSQQQERYASVRHVVKKKQDRNSGSSPQANLQTWADAGYDINAMSADERAAAASSPNRENYKHEGDTVNTEMRTTAKRIEFRSGDNVVGYYDKGSSKWVFIGEVHLGSEDASHPIYGVNGGVGMTTATSGSGAVLVNATKPGPPTSMDGQPFEARDAEIAALKERVAALEARINS